MRLSAPRAAASSLSLLVVATLTVSGPVASAAPPAGGASAVLSRMSLAQRVGQLFMVASAAGTPTPATLDTIRTYHVGNVMLSGRSSAGTARTKTVSDALQRQGTTATTYGVPLFVATDQEGGKVQVLTGPGFSTMPAALTQGGWATTTLRSAAQTWGRQLRAAGVN